MVSDSRADLVPGRVWVVSDPVILGSALCIRGHIDRRFFKVREYMAEGHIITFYVPTDDLAADILTKALPAAAHKRHTKKLLNFQMDKM